MRTIVTPLGAAEPDRWPRRYRYAVRALMLAAVLATGCSFQRMNRPEPPRSEDDCVPIESAVGDGVVAIAAGVAAGILFALKDLHSTRSIR